MSVIEVGSKVRLFDAPIDLEVLELAVCEEGQCNETVFRFKDPETGEDDWAHTSDVTPLT